MPALPVDIATYTNDGVVVRSPTTPSVTDSIRSIAPDAQDTGTDPIETFYDNPADAQAMMDERFNIQSEIGPYRRGIEIQDTIGLGTTIPITPRVPCFRIIDVAADVDLVCRTRSYSLNLDTDRYAIEVTR